MKIYDVVFCDDIRTEMNNKLSLMGIYDDRIIFHMGENEVVRWPLPFKLAILLRFKLDAEDEFPDRFEFKYIMNNKNISTISGAIKIETDHPKINLSLIGQGIPLEIGNLGFSVKLFKGDTILFSEEEKNALKILKQ